ncbi:MAG: helix-turn-helix domain-containing protein [Dehalococcoidia bacterium]|nr:helix-turn-helix domain-containing protein [Dehalococcoidia bacterium]
MSLSDHQLLDALSRMPFVDSTELAHILGEPHATVHRVLAHLLAEGIVGRVSHGTAHLPSSHRYHLTAQGVREAAEVLGFDTPSDYVRAYPMSKEWLTLLIRRMDAVASVYRLAASMSPGIDGLRSRVEFHRRGRFDATITLHDGRSFGIVRQGLALRRRSLYDRLKAIAQYDYSRRPGDVLVLVPSVWEERLTTRFCGDRNIDDCYVAVESRDALESEDRRIWRCTSFVIGSPFFSLNGVVSRNSPGGPRTQSPERKRASLPVPERMARTAPAFGLSPAEKRTLDLITDHPMIPREHLALWLGVSEGRVSQMMHSLVKTWGLVERRGKRGEVRYTLSDEGVRYVTHRDRAELPTTRGIWSTELTPDEQGRLRHVGHRIETWARQTKHAEGISWFLSQLEAETRVDPNSQLMWSVPTARSDRAYNWGQSAIAPDAVGHLLTAGLHVPFYLEHELRARHPQGVMARLRPYESYYWSPEHKEDQPPFPTTLFVVDTEEVEETYVSTAARMNRMSLPILVSCIPVLSTAGILGESWRPLWEPSSPRLALSGLNAYQWDSLYHRMRPRPIEASYRGRR